MSLIISSTVSVLAIADPDTQQINAVWVYRNCIETGDQLYLIDYTLDYTVSPDENITEAFLVRLMDGSTELRGVAPYSYYDDGYDRGLISIYFNAADAPTWDGSYKMYLVGNPMLSWSGSPPKVSLNASGFVWTDGTIATNQVAISSRILAMAEILEDAWSVDLIDSTASGSYLTVYGESYFTNVVSNLRIIAPHAFSGQIIQPELDGRDFTGAYSADLAADISGTPLDLTDLATAFGTTRAFMTGILYYAAVVLFLVLVVKTTKTYKPIVLLSVPLIIGGAFLGVSLVVTALAGFLALLMIGYQIFYAKSTV